MSFIDDILAAEDLFASRIARVMRTHTRHITAAIVATLLCAGGGAFAVASFGPDASELPVRNVLEAVTPLPIAEQVEALDRHEFTLFRSGSARASDTAEALFNRLGIVDPEAAAFVRRNPAARAALLSQPGRTITVEVNQQNQLQRLTARWIPDGNNGFRRFIVQRQPSGLETNVEPDALTATSRLASGVVRSTLFAATDEARIPDAIASQLADIFANDLNLHSLRKGDRFAVVYETFEAEGQDVRTGRVLSAEFENNGTSYQALWFQEPGSKGGYYRSNGESLLRAYLSSPVEFSRVTSGFAMRMHPILNTWRKHNGIDFAAPTGTPVRTVGDGVVEFAGQQNGYGNVIVVKHRNHQSTAYAHLSRIDVQVGQSVTQGQFIGAVGATGWATGPHLHFEFRVNGEYQDPATITQEGGAAISVAFRPAFQRFAADMRAQLAAASSSVIQASAE